MAKIQRHPTTHKLQRSTTTHKVIRAAPGDPCCCAQPCPPDVPATYCPNLLPVVQITAGTISTACCVAPVGTNISARSRVGNIDGTYDLTAKNGDTVGRQVTYYRFIPPDVSEYAAGFSTRTCAELSKCASFGLMISLNLVMNPGNPDDTVFVSLEASFRPNRCTDSIRIFSSLDTLFIPHGTCATFNSNVTNQYPTGTSCAINAFDCKFYPDFSLLSTTAFTAHLRIP